jgi:choline dehydrogenase-like flavoprotein
MADRYDVVIVGAGISGAIIAKVLADAGKRVLLLEAGTDLARSFEGYQQQLDTFFGAFFKTPEGPYEFNPNAPQPDIPGIDTPGARYFVETSPTAFRSTYARAAGGTTLHWLGTCLRMLPEDFELQKRFGRGLDWPIGYDDLAPDYELAEWEIGVSADVGDQAYLGITFPSGYQYPMGRVPASWIDAELAKAIDGMTVEIGGAKVSLEVRSTPAGRNSTPIPGYQPVGAVDLDSDWRPRELGQDLARDIGERCQGNSACVPICPVQAKYNALKTLAKATRSGNVHVITQAVASRVNVADHRVTGIEYLRYDSPDSPRHTKEVAEADAYVLACHAVENAKLMLISGLPSSSGLVGKNLMDHPSLLAWGLMPEQAGPYRGPLSTSGVEDLRGGEFRKDHAAFRVEIGNDGWLWPMGAPDSSAFTAIGSDLFGRRLREELRDKVGRHMRFGCLVEQLADERNCVSIGDKHFDPLGLPQPVIAYGLDDYVLDGMHVAAGVAKRMFESAGIEDCTDPAASFAPNVTHNGETYVWDGAGHFAGTHVMGRDAATSVVDHRLRSWDYGNLFLAGPGSMPSMGTSNPTLTVAALAFRTAHEVRDRPHGGAS